MTTLTKQQRQRTLEPLDATSESLQIEVASQWQLMWWKFRKHRLAIPSAIILILLYLTAIFGEFLAPWVSTTTNKLYVAAPPQALHLFYQGNFGLYVFGYKFERDPQSFKRIWSLDQEVVVPVSFFVKGDPYKLWGLIPGQIHLVGPVYEGDPFYVLGTDTLGRDILSRIIYGSRVSFTVGLVGIVITFWIGILLGGASGLLGGWIDTVIQRIIEVIMSIPRIPLWLALAAIVPLDWTPLQVYFMISVLLALLNWTGLARVVRSKFLALREEEYVLAAQLDGCSWARLVTRHMLPSFFSHIIASLTLAIPGMILAETALSFLGLGLRPPIVSWGVMLQDTQQVVAIADRPWVLFPAAAIFVTVLAFNFFGDGLRDAADPYST
jgi:peptide/nickel transport system permease protein